MHDVLMLCVGSPR